MLRPAPGRRPVDGDVADGFRAVRRGPRPGVRETAERLGGEVAIRTEAGRGTTVELVVPALASSLEA
ncbi:MAG: hypothetical protein R3A52_29520 [Polyangiales bacterium]